MFSTQRPRIPSGATPCPGTKVRNPIVIFTANAHVGIYQNQECTIGSILCVTGTL